MIKIGEYINYQDGWRLLSHRYLKTDNIWKVTWQRDGYKQTKGNQQRKLQVARVAPSTDEDVHSRWQTFEQVQRHDKKDQRKY